MPQTLWVNSMAVENLPQAFCGYLVLFLHTCHIGAGGTPADNAVGLGGKRGFIDHAIPTGFWQLLPLTIGSREDMVDVDGQIEIGRQLDGIATQEVSAANLHELPHEALIRGTQPGLEAEKPGRAEIRIAYRPWLFAAIDPAHHVGEVQGIARFVGAAIEFAEHPTPVPAGQFSFDGILLEAGAQDRTDG